jgi:hypothetical protein
MHCHYELRRGAIVRRDLIFFVPVRRHNHVADGSNGDFAYNLSAMAQNGDKWHRRDDIFF